jgi:hypothetical protein
MRSAPIPDAINHSFTASTVDCEGEKKSITSLGVIWLPEFGELGVELYTSCQDGNQGGSGQHLAYIW